MANYDVLRADGRMTLRAPAGCVHLEFPTPDVALIAYEGVAYESFVAPISGEIERKARFPVALCVDAEALSSYETGFRKLWTAWMDQHKPRAVYILSSSRLVAMGISLANAVLGGGIRGFSSRAEFERAVAELGRGQSAAASL